MLLSLEEAHLFFKLHRALMQFANERLNVVASGLTPSDFGGLPPERRVQVVQAFLGRPDLIDVFVTEDPHHRSPLDIAKPVGEQPDDMVAPGGWIYGRHPGGANRPAARRL